MLSNRWRSIWKMLPRLEYIDPKRGHYLSVWYFLDKSLQLHKAPLLERLRIRLGEKCPVDPDVGNWVLDAVNRCIQELNLDFDFLPTTNPTSLPKSLYTCKTLVKLTLQNKILVDVPSPACLPSLQTMDLICVVYKDQDSHVRLLSSCPVLKFLVVFRGKDDNVTRFCVKVPSLKMLRYDDHSLASSRRSLVIDSPGLRYLQIDVVLGDNYTIHNLPRLDVASVKVDSHLGYPLDKFLTCVSSVKFLKLETTEFTLCSDINFSRLIELKLSPHWCDNHWMESLMHFLHNSPKLKVLMIYTGIPSRSLSWNQPSSVPECLLSHLEIFEWMAYKG